MRILIIVLLATLTSAMVRAEGQATGPGQILDAASSFLDGFSQEQADQGLKVTYTPGNLDSRLSLAPCGDNIQVEFSGDPWSSTQPTLLISCSGERPWRMYLSTSLEIRGDTLVAARPLNRGERLTPAMVTSEPAVINSVRRGAITDMKHLIGMEMKRPVNAGTVFTPNLISVPDAVARGDHVMIVARSGRFSVRTRGKALADGGIGEQVLVENLASARKVRARVISPGHVEIAM